MLRLLSEKKRAHTTHFIVSCGHGLCKSFRGRYMVSDGVLLVQKLLKFFTFDAFCIAHEYNKLAAILRGEFSKTVLPYTKIDRCLFNGQQPLFTKRYGRNSFFGVSIASRQGTEITVDVVSEVERNSKIFLLKCL